MLALSMVVIASMVGAPGLGRDIIQSLNRIDVGLGFEAGLSVVILAILLDRLTSTLGSGRRGSFARPRRSTPTTDRPVGDDSTGEKPVDTVPVTTSA
jgi:hypothetical protein